DDDRHRTVERRAAPRIGPLDQAKLRQGGRINEEDVAAVALQPMDQISKYNLNAADRVTQRTAEQDVRGRWGLLRHEWSRLVGFGDTGSQPERLLRSLPESIMPKSSDRGYLMGLPMKIHKILQIED